MPVSNSSGNGHPGNGDPGNGYPGNGYQGNGYPVPRPGGTHAPGQMSYVDTDGLVRGAQHYRTLGENVLAYADVLDGILMYEPLNADGSDDEAWQNFSPDYKKTTRAFLSGIRSYGEGLQAVGDAIEQMAGAYAQTEFSNTLIARQLGNLVEGAQEGPAAGPRNEVVGGNGTPGQSARLRRRGAMRSVRPGQQRRLARAAGPARPGVVTAVSFVDQHGTPVGPDFVIGGTPQVLVDANGEPIGVLAATGTGLGGGGADGRMVFLNPDGTEAGYFQPVNGHSFDEAVRDGSGHFATVAPFPEHMTPVHVMADVAMPQVPQIMTNGAGDQVGLLVPAGAGFVPTPGAVVLTGPDGRDLGFFQPFGDHTFDEVARGVATPVTLGEPPVFAESRFQPAEPMIPSLPVIEGEPAGQLSPRLPVVGPGEH